MSRSAKALSTPKRRALNTGVKVVALSAVFGIIISFLPITGNGVGVPAMETRLMQYLFRYVGEWASEYMGV